MSDNENIYIDLQIYKNFHIKICLIIEGIIVFLLIKLTLIKRKILIQMKVRINAKQLGKKHPVLQETIIDIKTQNSILTVTDLINLIIEQQISRFTNASSFEYDDQDKTHKPEINYLNVLTETGKAGFGAIYNTNLPDKTQAQEMALEAFTDGVYAVFYGADQLERLEQTIDLSENKLITFIRLTFLAGSYW